MRRCAVHFVRWRRRCVWVCLAFSLLIADVINNWQDLRLAVATPARVKAPIEPRVLQEIKETI